VSTRPASLLWLKQGTPRNASRGFAQHTQLATQHSVQVRARARRAVVACDRALPGSKHTQRVTAAGGHIEVHEHLRLGSGGPLYYPVGGDGIDIGIASFFVTNSHHSQKYHSGKAQFVTAYYDSDPAPQPVSQVPDGAWVFDANRINLRFTPLDSD
jgi:hypothetical protein